MEIVGREMRINGQPIFLKGVAWAPTPVGNGPGNYYAQAVETDAVLMAAAGINAVRTYGEITDREVLDILWDNGIYVMMTVYYGYSETAASTAAKVCALKDHPAIIGWVVGNEWNYNNLAQDISFDDAVTKVGVIIDAIKENDDTRPASTIYGGLPPDGSSMPSPTLTSGAPIITPASPFTISLASGPQFMMGHYTLVSTALMSTIHVSMRPTKRCKRLSLKT